VFKDCVFKDCVFKDCVFKDCVFKDCVFKDLHRALVAGCSTRYPVGDETRSQHRTY
jgi:hypothetical protein